MKSKVKSKNPVAVLVIPTYNEVENISNMLEYLNEKTFSYIKNKNGDLTYDWQMKVLVVDGNSPDGTGKVVEKIAKKYSNIFLYNETSKDGIGAAYLKGFKYSMENLDADYVFEFDGDFQHPPETIPVMLKELENGYDYVIGSRKVKGGSNPKGWGFKRVFYSEVGGFIARFIMFFPFKNFWKITDPTTGLKVTRVKGYIDQMDLDYNRHLWTRSFGYKLQLLYETLKMKAKFKEIPLKFDVRNAGESKIETSTAKDIFKIAIFLRLQDETTKKFIKFGIVGTIGFFINFFGLKFFNQTYRFLPVEIGVINFIANATAAELSIISNFIFNNLWTFAQERLDSIWQIFGKFIAFNLSSIFSGILVPSTIIGAGTQIWGDQYRQILLVVSVLGFTVPYNWFIYNKFIWNKKNPKNKEIGLVQIG